MIKIIILGIVQGLTEFLPISSSGHLSILENYLGITKPVSVTAFLHLGTFFATLLFFREDIIKIIAGLFKRETKSLRYTLYIIMGNIPIVVFALLFRNFIESTFTEIRIAVVFLGITGIIVLLTSIIKKCDKQISLIRALIVGVGQMFAVFPGLSRSGLTIATGLFTGLNPEEAFRFSFLLSLPAVLGANLIELREITNLPNAVEIFVGMFISLVSGYIALKILRVSVQKWFHLFGIYCLLLSVLFLFINF